MKKVLPVSTIVDGKGQSERIQTRIEELQQQIEKAKTPFEQEKLQERLAKFVGGVAIIHVGGNTETEVKEKKDRVDDALQATKAAIEEGIVPGGGSALLYAREAITNKDTVGGNGSGTITSESVQIARLYNRVLSIDEIRQNYYQAPIVTTNLSQMWDAGNIVSYESGTTYTYDLVTDSVTGTTENGVLFSRGYGGFWTFDGTNDRILLGSSITMGNGSTGWTISAWVKTTTNVTGLGQGTIISNQSGGPVYSQLCINSGKICYWVYKTSWVQYLGNSTINTGNWVNLVWRNNVSNTNLVILL